MSITNPNKIYSVARKAYWSMKLLCVLAFVQLLLLSTAPNTVQACTFMFGDNHWYVEHYEFNPEDLPPGVSLFFTENRRSPIPAFNIENSSNMDWYIHENSWGGAEKEGVLSTLELAQAISENTLDPAYVYSYGEPLTSYPHGDFRVPERSPLPDQQIRNPKTIHRDDGVIRSPETLDLVFFTDSDIWITPIHVTYSLNPDYRHDAYWESDLSKLDRLEISQFVVIGKITGASRPIIVNRGEFEQLPSRVREDGTVHGAAEVEVKEWLVGQGPSVIHIGDYGVTNCHSIVEAGSTYMFFIDHFNTASRTYVERYTFRADRQLFDDDEWAEIALQRIDEYKMLANDVQTRRMSIAQQPVSQINAVVFAAILFLGALGTSIWNRHKENHT